MRLWIVAALVGLTVGAAGCKDQPKQQPTAQPTHRSAAPADAAPINIDWTKCDAAIVTAASAPLIARPRILIEGCQVCGDWKPILSWNVPQAEGGPKHPEIEATMVACNAFCDGNAKHKFLGTLDKTRGTDARTPWRQLADICKDKVSAVPDNRFMTAPYFALDRIARIASARGGETATKLAALVLPLPNISVAGTGVVLPEVEGVSANVGSVQITVLGDAIHIGSLPRAKLGPNGITVELGPTGYPGTKVALADLDSGLKKLIGDDKTETLTLLAPSAMLANGLVPIIAAASKVAPVYLAAHAQESPQGWSLAGVVPIALAAGGTKPVVVTAEMTVNDLARELATRAATKADRVGVTGR